MHSILSFFTVLTWLTLLQGSNASADSESKISRRHVSVLSRAAQQNPALTSNGIWSSQYNNAILATSYDTAQYGGRLGGACGWNQGTSDHAIPFSVNGAAQKLEYFANGLACGTCVQLTPTEAAVRAKNPLPITVSIVNSCPGSCASLDVEANIVTEHFHGRLGQWHVQAKVVPCGFLGKGIHIEYQPISTTPYDFRVSLRFQSGAFASINVKKSSSSVWLPMKQAETSQWTLKDNKLSTSVLGVSAGQSYATTTIDFEFTSFTGETIHAMKVPNPLAKPKHWMNTKGNFAKS